MYDVSDGLASKWTCLKAACPMHHVTRFLLEFCCRAYGTRVLWCAGQASFRVPAAALAMLAGRALDPYRQHTL